MTNQPKVGDLIESSTPIKAAHAEIDTAHGIAGSFTVEAVEGGWSGPWTLTLADSRLQEGGDLETADRQLHTYVAAWPFEAVETAEEA